ncbi:MAG: hypothetical protein IJ728_04075 [Selenomonadaceae bacterium]|nr:hypothetical protein [Selenomonadaceae bacterium]
MVKDNRRLDHVNDEIPVGFLLALFKPFDKLVTLFKSFDQRCQLSA